MAMVLNTNIKLTLLLMKLLFVYYASLHHQLCVGHLERPPVHDEPLLAFRLHQSSWWRMVVEAAECSKIMKTNATFGILQ